MLTFYSSNQNIAEKSKFENNIGTFSETNMIPTTEYYMVGVNLPMFQDFYLLVLGYECALFYSTEFC